jgi:hypothetical protein
MMTEDIIPLSEWKLVNVVDFGKECSIVSSVATSEFATCISLSIPTRPMAIKGRMYL